MEIDINKDENVNFISSETSTKYDVNKLNGVSNISQIQLMNNKNKTLVNQSEIEFKKYFTENKTELINALNEIILLNKKSLNEETINLINNSINQKIQSIFNNGYYLKYKGSVNTLPLHSENGNIYELINDNKKSYHIYLNGSYLQLVDSNYYNEMYYNKEALNSKLRNLNLKLNNLLEIVENIKQNSITNDDYTKLLNKISDLKNMLL